MDWNYNQDNNSNDFSCYKDNCEEYNKMFYDEKIMGNFNESNRCCCNKENNIYSGQYCYEEEYDYCYNPVKSAKDQCYCYKPNYCDDQYDYCKAGYDPCYKSCCNSRYDECCDPCYDDSCCDPCYDPCSDPCCDPCYDDSCCEPCCDPCYDDSCCDPCYDDSCCDPCSDPCCDPCYDDSCCEPCCDPCCDPCYDDSCCDPCYNPCYDEQCYDPCCDNSYKKCCKKSCKKCRSEVTCYDYGNNIEDCCREQKGSITVKKVLDCNGLKPLSGARINLYSINNNCQELVASKISDADGIVVFDCLENGCYKVLEIIDKCMFDTPKYMPCNEIKITKNNKKCELKIINKMKNNEKVRGKAIVEVLTDKCGCKVPLKYVEVQIFSCIKENSKLLAKGKTDSCGKIIFNNLLSGDYRIHVNVDMCYFSDIIFTPSDDFSININNRCVETSVYVVPRSEQKKGSLKAYAVLGSIKGEEISGLKFNLYKVDGCKPELIGSKYTDSSGIAEFDCLEYGSYRLSQVVPNAFCNPKYVPSNNFVIDRKNRNCKIVVINRLKR